MIQVQNLSKDFSLNKKQRKELGDEYKNTKILLINLFIRESLSPIPPIGSFFIDCSLFILSKLLGLIFLNIKILRFHWCCSFFLIKY